jgi:hypothetical protein
LLHTPPATANQGAPSMQKHRGSWFPTPTATSYGTNKSMSAGAKARPSLQTMAAKGLLGEERGPINPDFVEWMMGFPPDWTVI